MDAFTQASSTSKSLVKVLLGFRVRVSAAYFTFTSSILFKSSFVYLDVVCTGLLWQTANLCSVCQEYASLRCALVRAGVSIKFTNLSVPMSDL